MIATTTATVTTAITLAGFEVSPRITTTGTVLGVACPTTSERVFDLITVLDIFEGLTIYPAGDEVTTCVAL